MNTSRPDSVEEAMQRIAAFQQSALAAGVELRLPPPLPTTCCGRGCTGCVWEGWMDAVTWWLEDAGAGLQGRPGDG